MKAKFGKGILLRKYIKRRQMPKRYAKYGFFILSRDYLV